MRREYDYTYDVKDKFSDLVSSIHSHKSTYGCDYIELARKFDNSDYQWVCYRSDASSDVNGATTTTGYFVLFDINGNVIKDIAFSFPYLCHGITQASLRGQSNSQAYFQHIFLAIYRGNTVRTNYLDVYWISCQVASGTRTWSDIKLHNTGKDVKNFVTSNVFAITNNTGLNNGQKVFFFLVILISQDNALLAIQKNLEALLLYHHLFLQVVQEQKALHRELVANRYIIMRIIIIGQHGILIMQQLQCHGHQLLITQDGIEAQQHFLLM